MRDPASYDVAIIGAGLSGSLVAFHILQSSPSKTVVLLDKRPCEDRGLAYGTQSTAHILNVPADKMSAFSDRPTHFVEWLQQAGYAYEPSDFVSRSLYRQYLNELFVKLPQVFRLTSLQDEAIDISRLEDERYCISCAAGAAIVAGHIVLATGNLPFTCPTMFKDIQKSKYYINNPYLESPFQADWSQQKIFLLGSSLTAIDVILQGESEGYAGQYILLSRHGLLPLPHIECNSAAGPESAESKEYFCGPRRALAAFRKSISERDDWQQNIDALRSSTQDFWSAWSSKEKARFLRHLSTYWGVHRHRIPAKTFQKLEELKKLQRLVVLAGRIQSVLPEGESLCVQYRMRGAATTRELLVDRVLNCTGPGTKIDAESIPLFSSLLKKGFLRADSLALGVDTNASACVLNGAGQIQTKIFALGPLRRGVLWETTAAREIRMQALQIATRIVAE
jgi:uncharacterized NAD(P)/FAD-binding protein YdhS